MKNTKLTGYIAVILSTVLLGAMGIFVRNISANGYVITFARLGVGLLFLIVFLLLRGELKNIQLKYLSFSLAATGILLAVTSLCYINAINNTTLANAVFLLYLGPLLGVGLTSLFLKEKFTPLNALLLIFAFVGFLFLLEFKISFNKTDSIGNLWGGGAALCYALYVVFNRNIQENVPTLTRSFYQLLIGTLVIVPFLDATLFDVTTKDIYWLVAIGFFHGFFAFSLIILALKHLKAVEYGTISYIEPIIASLIGFLIYSESLTLFQSIGCAIVLIGGIIQIVTSNKLLKK